MTAHTLLHPEESRSETSRKTSTGSRTLPQDLLEDAQRRLHVLALLIAFVFFMASFLEPVSRGTEGLAWLFGRAVRWAPDVISISLALAVAAITKYSRFSATAVLNLGLVFEVVISFGIAAAEYSDLYASNQYGPGDYGGVGMSWVAIWVLLYTMVVPTLPRKALLAMIASVSAVPIVLALRIRFGSVEFAPGWTEFTLGMVLQYGLVVLMGYVGARVVYKMGSDVGRAREMGSYRLMDRIGRGGMGEVWKAKHRMLARAAAIKLVPPDVLGAGGLGRETILGRFEREAQATASMRSPHTIELYDFGIADNGTFYYVMELLSGLDLSSLVARFGPVPPERAIHILRQTCHSLAEAHEAGLIHRDVKPANIFVARYGRDVDFVKVLDFGLVKSHTNDVANSNHLTADGNVAGGTPAYIAPEQALGDPVDGRTDLYALGCVAYWLVTGKQLFEGQTAMELISDHLRTAPVPPSQRVDLEVPADLESLIMRCLEKEPERRPRSADEFSDVLEACEAAGRWTQERARAWWADRMTEETEGHDEIPFDEPSPSV
ncbi:MAG: serine/threonine-protein kinase [Planctomycetota bacterium]|jgi:serine/threonine-protein kinase